MKDIHFSDIATERLTLRQIDERDAESIYRHFANERVSEYPVDCEPYENASEALELINPSRATATDGCLSAKATMRFWARAAFTA